LSEKSSKNDNYLKFLAFFIFDRHRSCADLTEAHSRIRCFCTSRLLPHLQRTWTVVVRFSEKEYRADPAFRTLRQELLQTAIGRA